MVASSPAFQFIVHGIFKSELAFELSLFIHAHINNAHGSLTRHSPWSHG